MYSLCNMENLKKSIHVQLFKKQKVYSQFFALLPESTLNFEHENKDDPRSLCIS